MSQFSRHIALISNREADHLVFSQGFADHPDRLTLTCLTALPADIDTYGLIITDDGQYAVPDHINRLIITERPLRIGALIDKAESLLFSTVNDEITVYKNYVLDRRAMQLQLDDKTVILTEREIEILTMLMHAGEKGCRREEMLDHIWGYRADLETHTLETHIYRLRQKIEDQPNDPLCLVTFDNGYRLD